MSSRNVHPRRAFEVPVRLERTRVIKIHARDPEAARIKAEEIVTGWDGVTHAEAGDPAEVDAQ